jgi:hypothetical protein
MNEERFMENIRELIDDELQRVEPHKLPTALIAMQDEEFEVFTKSISYYWDENNITAKTLDNGSVAYEGHPVIRIHDLPEPVVIYTMADLGLGVTDYLARD